MSLDALERTNSSDRPRMGSPGASSASWTSGRGTWFSTQPLHAEHSSIRHIMWCSDQTTAITASDRRPEHELLTTPSALHRSAGTGRTRPPSARRNTRDLPDPVPVPPEPNEVELLPLVSPTTQARRPTAPPQADITPSRETQNPTAGGSPRCSGRRRGPGGLRRTL